MMHSFDYGSVVSKPNYLMQGGELGVESLHEFRSLQSEVVAHCYGIALDTTRNRIGTVK